jgi:hypothetical protein
MMEKSALQEILEGLQDYLSFEIREYSGRGMYGRTCLGVVTNPNSVHSFELAYQLGRAAREVGTFQDIEEAICPTQEDSMGLGSVIYWPRVPYVKDEREQDDEDEDINDA